MAKPWLEREANGKYMGEVTCQVCGEPARYKTLRMCRRCYDRQRQTGVVIGPPRHWSIGNAQKCMVPDCETPMKGQGLCQKHYSVYFRMKKKVERDLS
jgi:ribosomal protein S14